MGHINAAPTPSVNLTEQMLTYINYIVANQSASGWLGPDDMPTDGNQAGFIF